ncbi:MAG: DUF2092 domain-containing protein [Geminicoccaceae bacterium]
MATTGWSLRGAVLAGVLGLGLAGCAATGETGRGDPATNPPPPQPRFALPDKPELEPKAVELLKQMSAKLAAAKTLSFTAVASYDSLARTGLPLAYMTESEVTLQRPDKLRVITPADGPASEFYYDGKTVLAYTPSADLVAKAQAPDTIDATLHAAYANAAIYFPFTDVIVSDPWRDLADELKLAFFVGQSKVEAGITTDIVVIADNDAQAQIWIGAEDHLPRRIQAYFFSEGGHFRHDVSFSDWKLNAPVDPGSFTSAKAAAAKQIPFAPPGTN